MGKPTDVSKAAYAAYMSRNIPALMDLLADDVEWAYLAKPEYGTPYGGKFRGKAEVGAFFSKLSEVSRIVEFEPKEFFEGPSHCAVLGRSKGQSLPDGDVHDTDWIQVAVINDAGKISRWFGTEDSAARWKK
mgnify:FL=1